MKTSFSLLLFYLLTLFNNIHAQVPSVQWQKSLGGSNADIARCIKQTTDGGFIVAGRSSSNDNDVSGNHGQGDSWIVKLNSLGDLLWQKCYGGSYDEEASSIQQTSDSGFIVAGYSNSNDSDVSGNHGNFDYWIMKLDMNGNLVWQKSLGGSGPDLSPSIQQTADNGYIIVGTSSSNDGDVTGHHGISYPNYLYSSDYWIVKLDAAGNLVWEKSLGGSDQDLAGLAESIQQTTDGGFIIAGTTYSNDGDVSGNHGDGDYWVVKLDTAGNLVWQKSLGGIYGEGANSVRQTIDSGFIVAGETYSNDDDVTGNHSSNTDYWIVKLDEVGNLVWQKCLGGSNADEAVSIQQTTDNGFIIAGYSNSNDSDVSGNHGVEDYWIVKLSGDVTGITSPPNKIISIYPNPVQNELTINSATPASQIIIRVYDLHGRMLNLPALNFPAQTSNSIQFNTKNLSPGFYTLQIVNTQTGESGVGKFVKE